MKRTFDILVSAAALILLSPLLLPIAIFLRLTGEGEVFYRQERVGRGKRNFSILKFATMLKNSPNLPGGDITVGDDPRILPAGKFLRDTKLNELPQLLNILAGDMSIIGWRPLTPRVADLFPPEHWDAVAHVRPGLSGIGSIAFREEESLLAGAKDRQAIYSSVIVPYKSQLEVWYAERHSLALDLKLIALTMFVVVKPGLDIGSLLRDLPKQPPEMAALRAGTGAINGVSQTPAS